MRTRGLGLGVTVGVGFWVLAVGICGFGVGAARAAEVGGAKVEEVVLGPTGKWVGFAVGARGHAAVLGAKGSRAAVWIDGVEGPKVDQLIGLDGVQVMGGGGPDMARDVGILFSDDGAHCAYFGKMGDEYVLFLDGKELVRGPYKAGTLGRLAFTAGGKHLYFGEPDPAGGYRIVVDGKPGPSSREMPAVVASGDGSHFAYVNVVRDASEPRWAVVDGRQVNYFGEDLQFNSTGHLVAVLKGKGGAALVVDGKAVLKAPGIEQVWLSRQGAEIALMVQPAPGAHAVLTVNGKAVAGTEGLQITKMYFSPDGKRWAALCSKGGAEQFMIIDGKKGQAYQHVDDGAFAMTGSQAAEVRAWATGRAQDVVTKLDFTGPAAVPGFSGDSSKFMYVATNGGQAFLITNDDESDGYANTIVAVVGAEGKRVGFIANVDSGGSKAAVVVDGKATIFTGREGRPAPGAGGLVFSPDGSHYLFSVWGTLYLDGVAQPGMASDGHYGFSPDGKHVMAMGNSTVNPNVGGFFVDGKVVGALTIRKPIWTADGKHLYWFGYRQVTTNTDRDVRVLFVDGKEQAMHFGENGLMDQAGGNYYVSPEGVLTFIARSGDDLKAYKVTPGEGDGVEAMLAGAGKNEAPGAMKRRK